MGRRATARRPLTGLPRARESRADAGVGAGGGALPGPDPGLFGPASVTWRLDREAFLLLGAGPRALLLQIAHPAVAAGVAEHSDFRADPWARLAGTLRSYLRIVYGTTAEARSEIRRLNGLHRNVRGSLDGGGTYEARDPALALWVHATLVDSTIATADAWLAPLDRAARTRVYAESVPVGRAFGIPDELLPADLETFEAYVASMLGAGGPVRPGPLARELAAAILSPPAGPPVRTLAGAAAGLVPGGWLERAVAVAEHVPPAALGWLLWPAIGLLPAGVREAYGFRWGPVERGVARWLVASWRAWNAVLPPAVRWMPQARAADRRMRGG
ncbi:MAG TPA: oxygenase MpaB family protein [Candidatus Limnocylindrales bacterium]|nr:oxygenase MpaB family protein [Candidatus Limnocylindrales bacterium]